MNKYTRRVSAVMSDAATANPNASGGAVGRSNTDTRRARIGAGPIGLSGVSRAVFTRSMAI